MTPTSRLILSCNVQDILGASEAPLVELRNAHLPHQRAARARLQPLARFASLEALTLCRVFGNKGDPAMKVALRQLPTSLRVRQRCLIASRLETSCQRVGHVEPPLLVAR